MSAKLLYTLTDEKADLHKHIGCMNGFFQIFDRHHFLTGRRRVKSQKTLPPIPGQNGSQGVELSSASKQSTLQERSVKKATTKEKHRASTESSRTSFSSSCSSTESSSYGLNSFSQNPSRDFLTNQPNVSASSKPQPLDLHREARGLSVKTVTNEEVRGYAFKHVDSPRPLSQPKSAKQRESGLGEEKDRARHLIRDAPRFSFDGRESRDTFKSLKIKEIPRLSLDSRERTVRATAREEQQEIGSYTYNRPSSVVAKLMGLEALPSDAETPKNQTRLIRTCPEREVETLSRSSSRSMNGNKQSYALASPRNADSISVTKSTSSPKFPTEPAPWKQTEGRRGSRVVPSLKHQEADTKSSASVYGEIEKRLADIELRKSGKDLTALKRILGAVHKTNEMSESRKDNLASQTGGYSKLSSQRNLQNSSPRSSRSAIVIMKPAPLADGTPDSIMGSVGKHRTKDSTHRGNLSMDPSSCSLRSIDVNTKTRTSRSASSGTVSSRLQQKKNGTTTSSSDSNRARRQLSTQPTESGSRSPARKLKPKSPKSSSSTREVKNHGDAISQQSESSISSASHVETDTTSTNGSDRSNTTFFQHYGQKQKNLELKFMEDRAVAEPTVVSLEQPSPISVLDATFCRDESSSPVKKITNPFKDYEALNSSEAEWSLQARTPTLSSENDSKKSENVEHVVSAPELDESINCVTLLCEHSNPDHRYISQILLASGLLRDLDSGMTTIPFHSSGHPINPDLFLAFEQTIASIGLSHDDRSSRNAPNKNAVEKIQRKLLFDVVNDILGHKLVLESCSKQLFPQHKQAEGKLKSRQLATELFSEVDQLLTSKTSCLSDDGDDNLANISFSWGDMMQQSANWTYTSENEGLVLDIERLIFKDLISEVVNSKW